MNSGGPGTWRSRERREAIPKPVSRARPVAGLRRTFGGFTSLWISPFSCNPLRAVAIPTAKRRKRVSSIGTGRNRSSVSPPGSSSTSVICPGWSERARGLTAQDESSSSLNEYSCSIFFMLPNAGCIDAGTRRRTDGEPGWSECSPRYSTNSSSLRRASRTYCETSTTILLQLRALHRSTGFSGAASTFAKVQASMPVDERLELRRLADQYVEGGNFGLPRLVELRDVLGRVETLSWPFMSS